MNFGKKGRFALDIRHVSKTGHVSRIQRVQWHWPLDRRHVQKGCALHFLPQKKIIICSDGLN